MRFIRYSFFCTFFVISTFVLGGLGGGSNDTGGFGQSGSSSSSFSNSSESFGVLTDEEPPIDPGEDPESPDNPDVIPLDGGASILIALGLALGGRKIYKKVVDA